MCWWITLILIALIPLEALGDPTKRVHLIFSNHLDIGFHSNIPDVPGNDANVLSHYFRDYFPAAVAIAEEMRQRGGPERYKYLTHSFLVSLYLNDCPEKLGIYCPTPEEKTAFENAIKQGDIVWHAYPHNLQTEFLSDPGLLQYAVQLAHDLDRQFNLPPKRVISQRDVPGLTRAAIPILATAGVAAISVGVNSGSAPPDVPKHNAPFIWKDERTGTSLLAFWHPGGYSGTGDDPLDGPTDCVSVPGFDEVLCAAWRTDNAGPHSVDEIIDIYRRARENFPEAEVVASTYDEFIFNLENALESSRNSTTTNTLAPLPVVTQEIGDTWIYGIASDPARVAEYRALLRLRRASDRWDEAAYLKFSRLLLKISEHTCGVDTKEYPGDYSRWSNKDLQQALEGNVSEFQVAVESWQRQRAYTRWAVEELEELEEERKNSGGDGTLIELIEKYYKEMEYLKSLPNSIISSSSSSSRKSSSTSSSSSRSSGGGVQQAAFSSCQLVSPEDLIFTSDSWKIGLDASNGAISELLFLGNEDKWEKKTNPEIELMKGSRHSSNGGGDDGLNLHHHHHDFPSWASSDSLLAQVMYSTYDEDSYDAIWSHYAYRTAPLPEWFYKDFGKPNATFLGGAQRRGVFPKLENVWQCSSADDINDSNTDSKIDRRKEDGSLHIVARSSFENNLITDAGAPAAVYLEITSLADSPDLFIDVILENKTATRLPEATWFSWHPAEHAVESTSWAMSKLGQWLSPLEVMRNGSMGMHAVDDNGISVRSACGNAVLKIRSLDAALVSPGKPTPFPSIKELRDLKQGMHFNLHNNVWGTNYVMWWPYQKGDETIRFRFVVQVETVGDAGVAEQ